MQPLLESIPKLSKHAMSCLKLFSEKLSLYFETDCLSKMYLIGVNHKLLFPLALIFIPLVENY